MGTGLFFGGHEAAAHVNLAVVRGQCRMVRLQWHRLFLGPLVGSRVVLVVGGYATLAVGPATTFTYIFPPAATP